MMKATLIVAMDLERGIGKNNDLMWHLPNDMKFFKDTTQEQIVVMGRKNYDSIPLKYRPLTNRENVVLTRTEGFEAEGCKVFNSLDECMSFYKDETEKTVFIIGGGQIYKLALEADLIDTMYITHINHIYGADTFFPEFDLKEWTVETIMEQEVNERHTASFSVLKYTKRS
jgi:dihydrofolate reductase